MAAQSPPRLLFILATLAGAFASVDRPQAIGYATDKPTRTVEYRW